MATLIICPACGTRYETKAVIPPEGRKVRCSKCSHVWQAQAVVAPPAAAPTAAPVQPRPAQPSPPPLAPQPVTAPTVNTAMGGFAGIAPVSAPKPRPAPTPSEAGVAEQVARINAEITAAATQTPEPAKADGIFARLSAKGPAAPSADASMDEGAMSAPPFAAGIGDAGMGDAEMSVDPDLAAQAFPEERPRRKGPSVVAIGWLALALIVAGVIGTLALAPSAVMSVLPGAARLYALFGMPVGGGGLAFEGVRYGWTTQGDETVLEVQGEVVNLTSAPIGVPTVVIALRDANGDEISEWTTEIGEQELGAGARAPFLRQIPSPPSNVRSVKVRFAKAE